MKWLRPTTQIPKFIPSAEFRRYGLTFNEQIRELGMQLMECEQWSPEASAIMAHINSLIGQNELLPKGNN